jgi:hypothetical protein
MERNWRAKRGTPRSLPVPDLDPTGRVVIPSTGSTKTTSVSVRVRERITVPSLPVRPLDEGCGRSPNVMSHAAEPRAARGRWRFEAL